MKKILLFITPIVMLLFATGCQKKEPSAHIDTQEEKISQQIKKIKATAVQKNNAYYANKLTQEAATEGLSFEDTSTFEKLNNLGDATIGGVVGNLKAMHDDYRPFTMADILVTKVYKGDQTMLGKHISILFQGGNITLKDLADGSFEKVIDGNKSAVDSKEANLPPNTIVRVEFANERLPRVGEQFIAVIGKAPKGANNINQPYWEVQSGRVGMFWRAKDGKYEQQPQKSAIGGGGGGPSPYDEGPQQSVKMNQQLAEYLKTK